jgi:phosphoserine phosphatase
MAMQVRQGIKLICFDVDGTLVKHPADMTIWEVLNLRFGSTRETNRRRYEMYRRREITYDEWVALDVGDWVSAGATREEILESVAEFNLVEGVRETMGELKRRGFQLAVISGTIDILFDTLYPDHPFEDVFTNKIFFDGDGKLTSWQATPFDGYGKPAALRRITRERDIPISRSAFVGDGENDVPLLGVAGMFVAYEPRSDELEAGADVVIKGGRFVQLLEVFG